MDLALCLFVLFSLLARETSSLRHNAGGVGLLFVSRRLSSSTASRGGMMRLSATSKSKRDTRLEKMLEDVDFTRKQQAPQVPMLSDPLLPLIEAIALAADKRKAASIQAFRISHLTEITTFMVVVEGNSRPQNQAIALAVEEDVLLSFTMQPSKQGDAASGWILLDYGSVIVHIMTPQMRNFYKLERRWKDAEIVDLSGVMTPSQANKATSQDDESFGVQEEEEKEKDEDDPFWQ